MAAADSAGLERALATDSVEAGTAALITWADAGGGLMTTSCADTERIGPWVMSAFSLAHRALERAADDPEDPAVRAVLYLAERLRSEGVTLLEVAVGETILDVVVDWHHARGLPGGASLRRWGNAGEPPVRALAAEAVCVEATIEQMRVDPAYAGADASAMIDAEVAHARRLMLAFLEDVRAAGDAPACLTAETDAADAAIAAAATAAPAATYLLERTPRRYASLVDDHAAVHASVELLLGADAADAL